jgi:hypothetical protein
MAHYPHPESEPSSVGPLAELRRLIEEHGHIYAPDWDDPEFAEGFVSLLETELGAGRLSSAERGQIAAALKEFMFKNNPILERLARVYGNLAD